VSTLEALRRYAPLPLIRLCKCADRSSAVSHRGELPSAGLEGDANPLGEACCQGRHGMEQSSSLLQLDGSLGLREHIASLATVHRPESGRSVVRDRTSPALFPLPGDGGRCRVVRTRRIVSREPSRGVGLTHRGLFRLKARGKGSSHVQGGDRLARGQLRMGTTRISR
jgi:hypothetical protein